MLFGAIQLIPPALVVNHEELAILKVAYGDGEGMENNPSWWRSIYESPKSSSILFLRNVM